MASKVVLTDTALRRMRPPATGQREVWDAALPGFGLRITSNGTRSFVLMTRVGGRPVRLTWRYPAHSLAAARDAARAAIQAATRGDDPRRRPTEQVIDDVVHEYVTKYAQPNKHSWREDERVFAKYVLPRWQGRPSTPSAARTSCSSSTPSRRSTAGCSPTACSRR